MAIPAPPNLLRRGRDAVARSCWTSGSDDGLRATDVACCHGARPPGLCPRRSWAALRTGRRPEWISTAWGGALVLLNSGESPQG